MKNPIDIITGGSAAAVVLLVLAALILSSLLALIIHQIKWKLAQPPVITICAWCPDASKKSHEAIVRGCRVTHGICNHCKNRQMTEFDRRRAS